MDEVSNLLSDGSLVTLKTRGQTSNSSHDGVVSDVDDHSNSCSLHGIGREEGKILGLEGIVMSELGSPGLRLGFSSQRRVVDLETPGFQYP